MKIYSLLLLFLLVFNAIIAQKSTLLEEIRIIEKKKTAQEKELFKAQGQAVGVLTVEELNRNNSAFIEQALNTIAGVQVDKRTQLGGQRFVIRGYGNDQKFNSWGIKMYFNNIPLTTAEGITLTDDFDFSVVNSVEIIKGPATTLYGGGVGGVVKLYANFQKTKGLSVEENSIVGSFGLVQSQSSVNFSSDSSSIQCRYGFLQSEGYRPQGFSLKRFFSILTHHKFRKNQTLSFVGMHSYSLEGVSGQISYKDYYSGIDNGNDSYLKKKSRNDILSTRLGLNYEFRFSKKTSNATTLFYYGQDFERIAAGANENSMNPTFGLRSVTSIENSFSKNIQNELWIGTEIQESRSLISNFRFLGTDPNDPLKLQDISKGSYFRYITNQYSYFIHNKLTNNKLDFSFYFGISVNKIKYNRQDLFSSQGLISNYNKNLSFDKSFDLSVNPHIAFQKTVHNQTINLSYSEGYNSPTASSSFIGTLNRSNDTLIPEKGRMFDISIQGDFLRQKLHYQFSLFSLLIDNKLTQLSGINPAGGTYTYFTNTGNQSNKGLEVSVNYPWVIKKGKFIKKIESFSTFSFYNFVYTDFKTKFEDKIVDFSTKQVVGVPKSKFTFGLDISTKIGFYVSNTFNYMGDVYTDFGNSNKVKGFSLFNSKVGYKYKGKKIDFDIYLAGNNLTNQINYTFLFLGNNVNDSDTGSNYPAGVPTDVNPGPSKAYYFSGINFRYYFHN